MADITIVNGVYKPTYNWGAPSCRFPEDDLLVSQWEIRHDWAINFSGRWERYFFQVPFLQIQVFSGLRSTIFHKMTFVVQKRHRSFVWNTMATLSMGPH